MNKRTKKRLRKLILTIIFIGINVAVIIATAVNEFSGGSDATDLMEVKLDGWMLIPATLCFVGMIVLEYAKYVLMILKSSKPGAFAYREVWKLAWRIVMIGRYYDKVTPAAIGGQPAQILQMRKTGKISAGMATAIPVFSMIAGQITFILIAIPCFIFSGVAGSHPALIATAWFGLLFYAFWPVMVLATSISPKFTAWVINLVVRVLARFKIVKNRNEAIAKVEEEVMGYTKNVKMIAKSPVAFGGVLLMSLISNILLSFIPYFVLSAFGGGIGFWESFFLTVGVEAAVYFIPTPGNSGAAEGTFYVVFSRLSSGYVFWAMMLWRFFSYYIYIIVGPCIYLAMHFEKKRKERDDHKKQTS